MVNGTVKPKKKRGPLSACIALVGLYAPRTGWSAPRRGGRQRCWGGGDNGINRVLQVKVPTLTVRNKVPVQCYRDRFEGRALGLGVNLLLEGRRESLAAGNSLVLAYTRPALGGAPPAGEGGRDVGGWLALAIADGVTATA
jgi:hypothetical protein